MLLLLWTVTSGRLLLAFLLSAGLHELGHCLLCRLCCIRVSACSINACGAELRLVPQPAGKKLFCIAAGGPAANLLLTGVLVALVPEWPWGQLLSGSSLILALFNLLPVEPLDGGRMLGAIMDVLGWGAASRRAAAMVSTALLVMALLPGTALALRGNACLLLLVLWLLSQQRTGDWQGSGTIA
jgi:stage IV sporulation protein FB